MGTRVALVAEIKQRLVELDKTFSEAKDRYPYSFSARDVNESMVNSVKNLCADFHGKLDTIANDAKYYFSPKPEITKIFDQDIERIKSRIDGFETYIEDRFRNQDKKPKVQVEQPIGGNLVFGPLHTPDEGYIRGSIY